jgi:hypothetical protein
MSENDKLVGGIEARVDRNTEDISKLSDSAATDRMAVTKLTQTGDELRVNVSDLKQTVWGKENQRDGLLDGQIALEHAHMDISKDLEALTKVCQDAKNISDRAILASEHALEASQNINGASNGNVIQFGKLKLSGTSANVLAVLIVPTFITGLIMAIIYFIMVITHKLPVPF